MSLRIWLLCSFVLQFVAGNIFVDEMSQPTLFPEKQAAKRSIALKLADQNLLEYSTSSTTTSWSDLTTLDVPASEYYLISINVGFAELPSSIASIPKVKKISKIGELCIILVKTAESRDLVLFELRAAGYFNYQVEKSYQHQMHIQNTLDRLDQRNLPLDNSYTPIGTGAGSHVYIVDTGILGTHVEFAGRYEQDFVVAGEDTAPCNSHGSAVASVAAGATIGVASEAIVHDIKVGMASLECATYTSNIVDALGWIYENGTLPGVINLSLQGPGNSVLDAVIGQLYALGYFVVAAAGNAASATAPCLNSPSRAPYALSVGAIDGTDSIAYFSNYGDCVDIWAVGVDVPGADITDDNAYSVYSGTSLSTPVVTGLSAMYYALFHFTDSSQITAELQFSSVYNVIQGMPHVSNNRLASTYPYQSGATTPTGVGAATVLSVF